MILFDHNIFFLQKYGGISRYFIELCKQMNNHNFDYFIQATIHQNNYLKNNNLKKSKSLYLDGYPRYTRKIISSLNNFFLDKKINDKRFKILHNTYYGKFELKNKLIQICSIYDFTHEKFSKNFNYKRNIKKEAIENSDHFICISENTKKDLLEYYKVNEEKISVVPLGGDHLPNAKKNTKISKPFILYVGYREKYKNFEALLDAFLISKRLKNDFDIICFGDKAFTNYERNKIVKTGLENTVKHVDGDDQVLSNLYSMAECHVITSNYEGFGITVIEASNFECPVIHTGKGSLSDFSDGNGIFDGSAENLTAVLEKTLYSSDELIKLNLNAKKLKNNFTWNHCYENTIRVYNKLINI